MISSIGLTGPEILFAQVITQFVVMVGQTVMVLICSFVVFRITCEGDVGWISTLTILTGLCGMCFGTNFSFLYSETSSAHRFLSHSAIYSSKYVCIQLLYFLGFVIACICENERSATYVAMGSFLPIVMLCGIIWPIEGMHYILRYISYVLPLTKSTESMRSMLARGWPIDNPSVYSGFISTLLWICAFMTLSILLLKFKKG